jgi:plastocyanin
MTPLCVRQLRPTVRALAGAVALLCAAAAASCFSDRPGAAAPPDGRECIIPGDAIGPNRVVVLIRGFAFLPDTVRVRAGTVITWVNCEATVTEAHTTTADDGAWDSGPLQPGDAFAHVFTTAGAFSYYCRPHPSMRGVILVNPAP